VTGETIFSPCRVYRYTLWREWIAGNGYAMFIGLNPSTADETKDDPTIRRCIASAKVWGYAGLCMTNLFAYRATKPADMRTAQEPIGPENDSYLLSVAKSAGVIVAAWGTNGTYQKRDQVVKSMLPELRCLRLTKAGHPEHPLYLPNGLTPIPFMEPIS